MICLTLPRSSCHLFQVKIFFHWITEWYITAKCFVLVTILTLLQPRSRPSLSNAQFLWSVKCIAGREWLQMQPGEDILMILMLWTITMLLSVSWGATRAGRYSWDTNGEVSDEDHGTADTTSAHQCPLLLITDQARTLRALNDKMNCFHIQSPQVQSECL